MTTLIHPEAFSLGQCARGELSRPNVDVEWMLTLFNLSPMVTRHGEKAVFSLHRLISGVAAVYTRRAAGPNRERFKSSWHSHGYARSQRPILIHMEV
jgi:hypothetical protein